MAMQILEPETTHEELESDATVATETPPATRGNREDSLQQKIEPENRTETQPDSLMKSGSDEARQTTPATASTLEFDDEFVTLSRPITVATMAAEPPMFSETAGDDWPIGEGPAFAPLDGVSVPDPKIGEIIPDSQLRHRQRSTADKLVIHFDKIHSLETRIADACELELELRDQLKSLRKNRESMVERLTKLKSGDDEDDGDDDESDNESSSEHRNLGGESIAAPCSPQAWGSDPVEVLESFGLKLAKVEALRAASDAGRFNGTIKGLRDWIAKSDLWHRDVKGCGPTGADKISDALTAYMTKHPVADEPMTAEDVKRCEVAAEFLGHTKPAPAEGEAASEAGSLSVESVSDDPPKRIRKPRAKKNPKPAAGDDDGDYHAANSGQLDRLTSLLSGSADPVANITSEEQAAEAGRAAGTADQSCSANPFPRDHAFGKAWQSGWEATATGAM